MIQPRDVEHRRHHANVFGSHVGLGIAGGQRGNHQFWEAIGKRTHGCGRNGRAGGTAQSSHTVDGPLCIEPPQNRRCPERHGGHTSTPVSFVLQRGEILLCRRGHLCLRDVGRKGRTAKHTDVDHHRSQARALDPVTQKRELLALGVERADQRNGLGLESSR